MKKRGWESFEQEDIEVFLSLPTITVYDDDAPLPPLLLDAKGDPIPRERPRLGFDRRRAR